MDKKHSKVTESDRKTTMSRRSLLKAGSAGVALGVAGETALADEAGGAKPVEGANLAMVIDLQRCTGCGGCLISCKSENNIQAGVTFGKKIVKTVGTFPNVRFEFIPTLCNHCENPPCARACPTKAMHKDTDAGNITKHTPEKCIGCKTCMAMCPYGVISRNTKDTHRFWKGNKATIKGCTSTPAEVVKKVNGNGIPYYNPNKENSAPGAGLRYKGIVEKCLFCDHLVKQGKLPFCVTACPADARIFGDLNDPNSAVSKLLAKYRPWQLKDHLGTKPKVFYIREFNPGNYPRTKGSV
jgi:molybdopterin-containing oxidoreductase family iron-sulfur binding subunit